MPSGKFLANTQKSLCVVIRFATWLATATISALILLLITNIVSRSLFHLPILGTLEIAKFLTLVIVFFTVAHTEKERGHVKIDLIISKFPEKLQRVLSIVMSSLALVYFLFMVWQGILMMLRNIKPYRTSTILDIPFYPFMLIISVGSLLLVLQILVNISLANSTEENKHEPSENAEVLKNNDTY